MKTPAPHVSRKKAFTRAQALRALAIPGTDPTEERFTKHPNKHVRVRSEYLQHHPRMLQA